MNIDDPEFFSDQTFTFIISDTLGNQLATWDSPPITVTDSPVWVPMGFSFTSGNNTALKLQARFNETGYDDFAFDDFQFSVCGPTLDITTPVINNTCADSIPLFSVLGSGYTNPLYQWKKKNAAGIFEIIPGATDVNYVDRLPADSNIYSVTVGDGSLSCPIIESKEVIISRIKRTSVDTTICTGLNFEGFTTSGIYNDTFNSANGCDSVRTLNLTVNNCVTSIPCDNWLHIPNYSTTDYVSIGDLDISGDKITVEASFDADTNYFIPSTVSYDLVSKHTGPSDCNYLLRPVTAEITTTNGFVQIIACDYVPKKINHAALVYDGNNLKFYRNGFLMGSKPASGNLILNDLITKIGNYSFGGLPGALKGYMNEVRIWNIARTENEIKTYMNGSLPNPATQPGLVAYYTFDDLNNKQGNTVWNGVLHGAATINNPVPDCLFTADSCSVILSPQGISGIINNYTPVIALDPCDNKITVEGADAFKAGDTVLIIQMKGAIIDSSNTAAFGTVMDYKNAGNYEFNYIKSRGGNIIELKNNLTRQYDLPDGKVQLIRVPWYQNAIITDTLTCLSWDGRKGGVLVLNVSGPAGLNADINVTGRGFRGGSSINSFISVLSCANNDYLYPNTSIRAAAKGESIYDNGPLISYGKGKNASGGGGGNGHNSGGGGGGNAGAGGFGGYQLEDCGNAPFDNRGIGGQQLIYNSSSNRIFFGGGGGSGHTDNANGVDMRGGNGGGIAIIIANSIANNGFKIISNGSDAQTCDNSTNNCHDGSGGGGGAGTILIQSNTILNTTAAEAKGGNGGNLVIYNTLGAGRIGPGGGGGGGSIWLSQNTLPANMSASYPGGTNGVILQDNNNSWGATPGSDGNLFYNLQIPVDTILFKPNIDSVYMQDSSPACKTFNLKGFAITLANPIQAWQWDFGDNSSAGTQNVLHTYTIGGTYTVKLVVTDINGCKDSVLKQVSVLNCTSAISSVINDYTPVTALDFCTNKITVEDGAAFNTGDTVVLIQMKGALIDAANSASFGNITAYNDAGNYEFNYVKSKTGNVIELQNVLLRSYQVADGKVQLIRVPYYQTATITDTLTCLPWDGSKGGVLVLNSATGIILNAPIDVSNKGFRGGQIGTGYNCGSSEWAVSTGIGGTKGEGIADYIPGMEAGGARLANGGGGSFSANTGAGGGGNFGMGGLGGREYDGCGAGQQSIGGSPLDYTDGNQVFFGGGGGGSEQDNGQPIVAGGNGGGIAIIKAVTLNSSNQAIKSNGENITAVISDEGGAGGGAGGSVLMFISNYLGNLSIEANGGRGSDNNNQIYPARCHGPGGGGGGGFIGFNNAVPPSVNISFSGGIAGTLLNPASNCFNTTGGAVNGDPGGSRFDLELPLSTFPFKKNIDSVKIKDSITSCKSFDFKGLAFVNTTFIRGWEWSFDDGITSSLQDVNHAYSTAGDHDVKLVVTDNNGCKDSTEISVNSSGLNFDFTFEQDICNPGTVRFTAAGDTAANIFWSFGDGTVVNNIRNPLHVFTDTGYYFVQYTTGNTLCVDTIKKTIFTGFRNANIILTPDTTICINTSKLLRSNIDSSLQFCWSPASFLDNSSFANPTTGTPSAITYTLLAAVVENNLITNADFSDDNTNFSSDFVFNNTGLLTPGQYTVTTSPVNAGSGVANCKDHTTTTGNMLMASSDSGNKTVWKQSVNVIPNTSYIFSVWVQSVNTVNAVRLQLSINENIVLDSIRAPLANCNWQRYFVTWNAGNNTAARLAVLDHTFNTISGNDYIVLDDISFATYSIKRDSVTITVDTPFIQTNIDTIVCQLSPVQLITTGAEGYSWAPVAGLSNPIVANPVATPDTTTKYIVTGTDVFGCISKDSVTVTVSPKPAVMITGNGDTLVCRNTTVPLFATGGISYLWSPVNTLDNPNIPGPVAAPSANTIYFVKVTGANNCSSNDSVRVKIKPVPTFTLSPDRSTCPGTSPQLNASGGNFYLWSPAALVSNPVINNPLATATSTTVYNVIIKDTTCNDSALLFTKITILPLPIISAGKSNDVNCSDGSAILTATGALQYSWLPAASLNDGNSSAPIASPVSTTLYTVKGTDDNGCSNTAAVTVIVDFSGKATYLMPNAFSPNGDGHNDCYRIKYFGLVQDLRFVIFNRWGDKVFDTTDPDDCWDGNYKGIPAEGGNYVYYIKAQTACGPVEKKGNLILVR